MGREPEDAPCAGVADAAPEVLVLGQPLVQALDRVGGLREHGEALEVVAPLDHQLEVHLAARPERLEPLQDAIQAPQADDHLGREGGRRKAVCDRKYQLLTDQYLGSKRLSHSLRGAHQNGKDPEADEYW